MSPCHVGPVLHLFNDSLLAPEEGDTELCKSTKSCIVEHLNSKYADPSSSDLLDSASLLDSYFKARYISGEKPDALKHKVLTEAESLPSDQASCLSEPADQREAAVAGPPTAKKKKSLASFFEHSTLATTNTTHTQDAVETELSSYLLAVCVNSDPLKWWRKHDVNFTALGRLAKKSRCVPASSSPSEGCSVAVGTL